ncbi:DUF1835 domain-containing protein, partial [Bernardetia sp.]|uniref:DUF1835 domain-containing protein n=1 Tax=Bernardetia sp. TaxID=1937974 RepID=UPI0025B97779
KIQAIPSNSKVYMWFEDDLFCQVNFWFVASLLIEKKEDSLLFLVRPSEHSPYSFGHLKESELISSYENGIPLNKNIEEISSLWQFYKQNDLQNLLKTAQTLSSIYPFILQAVEAHIERQPSHNKLGRPKESIIQIMKELDTKEFAPIFREFTKREAIYGFGDLQVKRMFEEIINS